MTSAVGTSVVSGEERIKQSSPSKPIDLFLQVLNQQLDFCRCELP
jgi:hypothetical protein